MCSISLSWGSIFYFSIETITLGDKRIGIKTSILEEKATACNMLCCYADELKEGFFPWIDQVWPFYGTNFWSWSFIGFLGFYIVMAKQVAPILVPLLKFYFHEEVRKAAVSGVIFEYLSCLLDLFLDFSAFLQ